MSRIILDLKDAIKRMGDRELFLKIARPRLAVLACQLSCLA